MIQTYTGKAWWNDDQVHTTALPANVEVGVTPKGDDSKQNVLAYIMHPPLAIGQTINIAVASFRSRGNSHTATIPISRPPHWPWSSCSRKYTDTSQLKESIWNKNVLFCSNYLRWHWTDWQWWGHEWELQSNSLTEKIHSHHLHLWEKNILLADKL